MAKKKKRKHPGGRPGGAKPQAAARTPEQVEAARAAQSQRREAAQTKREEQIRRRQIAQRKQKRKRNTVIGASVLVLLLLVGFLVFRSMSQNKKSKALATAAGCTPVQEKSTSGAQQHLQAGQGTEYDSVPPTHGAHATVPLTAGVYPKAFSENPADQGETIYRAVHSLEHGYIILWHKGLSDADIAKLESQYRNEKKFILVPYDRLPEGTHLALTAWGRLQTCEKSDQKVIDDFVKRFREARTAPEPLSA